MTKKMISLEIPDNLREALRLKAFQENVSISELIRRILIKQLDVDMPSDIVGDSNENRLKD